MGNSKGGGAKTTSTERDLSRLPLVAPERQAILLKEYETAQNSAHFQDDLIMKTTFATWGLVGALFSFALSHLEHRLQTSAAGFIGVYVLLHQMHIQRAQRAVKVVKYQRCQEIERELGMQAHLQTSKVFRAGRSTRIFGFLSWLLVALWIVIVTLDWLLPSALTI